MGFPDRQLVDETVQAESVAADHLEVGVEVVRSRPLHGARDARVRFQAPVGREHHARPLRHQSEELLFHPRPGARSASSSEAASASERKVVRS